MRQRSIIAAIARWSGDRRSVLALLLALLICVADRPARSHDDNWIPLGLELAQGSEGKPSSQASVQRLLADLLELRSLANATELPLAAVDLTVTAPSANGVRSVPATVLRAALQANRRHFDPTAPPTSDR